MTLLKLAFALAILAVGWMVASPAATSSWPLAHTLSPILDRLVAALPAERGWWGVVVLALGLGAVLAALPKKAVARSRRRTASSPLIAPKAGEHLQEVEVAEAG